MTDTATTSREALASALDLVAEFFALTCLTCGLVPDAQVARVMRDHYCGAFDCMCFESYESCECEHGEPAIWVNGFGQRVKSGSVTEFDFMTTESELAHYQMDMEARSERGEDTMGFGRWLCI